MEEEADLASEKSFLLLKDRHDSTSKTDWNDRIASSRLALTFEDLSTFYYLVIACISVVSSDVLLLLQTVWLQSSWIVVLSSTVHVSVLALVLAIVYTPSARRPSLMTLCLSLAFCVAWSEIVPLCVSMHVVIASLQAILQLQAEFQPLFFNHVWVVCSHGLALVFLPLFCRNAYMDFHFFRSLRPSGEQKMLSAVVLPPTLAFRQLTSSNLQLQSNS